MLHYIENTTQDMADSCSSSRIHKMQERICNIKSSEEVSVRYMQRWEELELEKDEARAEGRAEGRASMALLNADRIEDCKKAAAL